EEPAVCAVDRRRSDEDRRAERERDDEHQRRQWAEDVVVESREDGEEHEPDDGVQPLLDQESHRVALAQGRRRRRRAEDHHEPERDEPEGDEDQQSLLDLTAVRASFVPHPGSFCTSLLNSSPRCSKLSNWSKDAHAGERSTTSPAAAAAATAASARSSVTERANVT